MEKRIRTYDLDTIKIVFDDPGSLLLTNSALHGARAIGFTRLDIIETIQQIQRNDFVKSMTTYANHKIWQDVYNTSYKGFDLYIKFQMHEEGHLLISFKEK